MSEKAGKNFVRMKNVFSARQLALLNCEAEKMKLMSDKTDEQKINRIIYLMQNDQSVDAPADATRWSRNVFKTRAVESKKSAVEKILAVLQVNLSPNRAAFGERSAAGSQARQMLFQAGEINIDLRIKEVEKGLTIHGQILGANFENCSVKIFNDEISLEVFANELNEFKLPEIPIGIYNLTWQKGNCHRKFRPEIN